MAGLDKLSIADLEAALLQKREYQAELVTRRQKLERELSEIDGEIAALGGGSSPRRGRPPGKKSAKKAKGRRGAPRGPRPENKMTMKGAVTKVLEKSKSGLTLSETAAAVLKLGYKSNAANFENVVYQCLYNNAEFSKGDDGKYNVTS